VKDYENRSIFSKDMDKSIVPPFFDSQCSNASPGITYIRINLKLAETSVSWISLHSMNLSLFKLMTDEVGSLKTRV